MSAFGREKSSLSVVMMGHIFCCFLQPFFGVDSLEHSQLVDIRGAHQRAQLCVIDM